MSVSKQQVQAMAEALFQLCLEGVINRASGVVAIGRNIQESGIGFEQLRRAYSWSTNGTRSRQLAEIRVRHLRKQRCTLCKLFGSQLIQIRVCNSHVNDVRANISDFKGEVVRNLPLHGQIPLL